MIILVAFAVLAAAPPRAVNCNVSPYWSKGQDCFPAQLLRTEGQLASVWKQAMVYATKIDEDNSADYDSPEPSYNAKAYLLASQRAWRDYRDKTCHLDYFKDPGILSQVTETECRLVMTRLRIKGLTAFMER